MYNHDTCITEARGRGNPRWNPIRRGGTWVETARYNSIPNDATGCLEWQRAKVQGYGVVRTPEQSAVRVHRAILEERLGRKLRSQFPDREVARHTCHNPSCVNPDHIIIGSDADNMRDKMEAGRCARGEQYSHAIVPDRVVECSRVWRESGETYPDIVDRLERLGYVVALSTVRAWCIGVSRAE